MLSFMAEIQGLSRLGLLAGLRGEALRSVSGPMAMIASRSSSGGRLEGESLSASPDLKTSTSVLKAFGRSCLSLRSRGPWGREEIQV